MLCWKFKIYCCGEVLGGSGSRLNELFMLNRSLIKGKVIETVKAELGKILSDYVD